MIVALLLVAAADAGAVSVSVEQAMDFAAQRSPQVRIADAALREAEAFRAGAGVVLPANPRLFGEARYGGGTGGFAASLEAPFELFGAAGARVKEAEGRAAAARADLDLERYLARYLAFDLYVDLRMSTLRLAEAEKAIDLAAQVVDASQTLVEHGASSEIDLAAASANLAEFRAAYEALQARHQSALAPLREQLGLAPGTRVMLTSAFDALPTCTPPEGVSGQHPSLQAIQARLALAEVSLDRLEKEVRPRLSFVGGIDAAPDSEKYGFLGIGIELPFAQRNAGPRALTAEQMNTDKLRIDLTSQRLLREAEARKAACEARRREADLLGTSALPQARKALDLVEGGWRAGKFDIFRVTAAARDVVRLAQGRIDVLEAAWKEHVAIQRLTAGGAP
jgi:outer membrane protein TolC